MLNIFLFNNVFEKSSTFWENREKLFWVCIWQFFRERRPFAPKINVTFFITNEVLNILLFSSFSKKKSCIFWENGKKPFLGPKSLLMGRGRLVTKMNITFFMGMRLWIFFHFTIFSRKRNIFGENGENDFK